MSFASSPKRNFEPLNAEVEFTVLGLPDHLVITEGAAAQALLFGARMRIIAHYGTPPTRTEDPKHIFAADDCVANG